MHVLYRIVFSFLARKKGKSQHNSHPHQTILTGNLVVIVKLLPSEVKNWKDL